MNGKQIARRISRIPKDRLVLSADFSRFDGSQSGYWRATLEQGAYVRAFPKDVKYLHKLFLLDFKAKVSMKNRDSFRPLYYYLNGSKPSGTAVTTDGNTMLNAGLLYIVLRLAGFTEKQALQAVIESMFYGDDAIFVLPKTADVDYIVKLYKLLGFQLVLEKSDGDCFPFLSRFFDLKTGDSFPNHHNIIRKITVVDEQSQTPREQQLYNKLLGYYTADPTDPMIKMLFETIAVYLLQSGKAKDDLGSCDHEIIYKIATGAWPTRDEWPAKAARLADVQFMPDDIIEKLQQGLPPFSINEKGEVKY